MKWVFCKFFGHKVKTIMTFEEHEVAEARVLSKIQEVCTRCGDVLSESIFKSEEDEEPSSTEESDDIPRVGG